MAEMMENSSTNVTNGMPKEMACSMPDDMVENEVEPLLLGFLTTSLGG